MKLPLRIIFVLCISLFVSESICRAQFAVTNLWELHLEDFNSASSPALAPDGTIYQALFTGKLLAISPQGKIQWSFKAGREIKSSPAINSDGTVYFGSWDTNFYALNPDGSLKWKFATDGIIDSSPSIAEDGTIYFGSHDKCFYALKPDGKLRWKFPTQGEIVSSPAINSDGAVYFTSTDGNLYALKPDGAEIWRSHTGGFTESSPVLDSQGQVYLGVNYSRTGIGADGKKLWDYSSAHLLEVSPAVAANGLVYFASAWGELAAYNAQGNIAWSTIYSKGVIPTTSMTIAPDGVIYVGDGRMLYALGATNSATLAKGSWPMFRANLRHTGRVNVN